MKQRLASDINYHVAMASMGSITPATVVKKGRVFSACPEDLAVVGVLVVEAPVGTTVVTTVVAIEPPVFEAPELPVVEGLPVVELLKNNINNE